MNLLIKLAKNHDTTLNKIANSIRVSNMELYKANKKDLNQMKIKILDDLARGLETTPQEIFVELMELEDETI